MSSRNLHNGTLQASSSTENTLIGSIVIARLVKSAVTKVRAIYPDYVRKFVDGVWLHDILALDTLVLIIFEPR